MWHSLWLLRFKFPDVAHVSRHLTRRGAVSRDSPVTSRSASVCRQEFTGDDADLYLDDREAALRRAQDEKRKQQAAVPGILNPHELSEQMQD